MLQETLSDEMKKEALDNMVKNLPMLRATCHLSQNDLAEMLGMSRQTIVMIENRKRPMCWNVFLALLFVFSQNCETAALIGPLKIYTQPLQSVYRVIE